jgi:hypothetical protein
VLGQVSVAVMQPDLGLPGPLVGLWSGFGSSGGVAVVPGRFDQQPAGVMVAARVMCPRCC